MDEGGILALEARLAVIGSGEAGQKNARLRGLKWSVESIQQAAAIGAAAWAGAWR